MKSINSIILLCFCFLLTAPHLFSQQKIKVACVGNSITYGAFIPNREKNSYPAQLQQYLGENYQVKNFGVSGSTLLSKGDYPYASTDAYKESLNFNPDIVFIKLGTNDSKPQNRKFLSSDYKTDYLELIRSYQKLASKPRIVLLTPVRCFLEGDNGISNKVMQEQITPVIKEIAYEQNLEIVNLYNLFGDKCDKSILPDCLHPSSIGAGEMAKRLYGYLTVSPGKTADVLTKISFQPTKEFNFHGYKGYVFNMNGVECYLVKPHIAAAENPWLIRARFWGHEPQTDINLLEQGFYLTYCDVADLYGSDKAVQRWNDFYKVMAAAGLNKKVVLEGMSRGGLIVYNWAASNAKKVACIYADAPVMDFKSWPMGEGAYAGSEADTKQMMAAYGFTSKEEALNWKKNPVDHAAVIAKAGIPILHVVGDADDVVPVAENTAVLAKRLAEKGYILNVIHKPGVGHHPHSLNNPEKIVNFILKATAQNENMCEHAICGNEYRSAAGWTEGSDWHTVSEDITTTLSGKKLKLLLLGNSITQGFGGNRKAVTYKPGKSAMDNAIGKDNWESAGISGDRTQHLLWRLKNGNYAQCQPENVIITIGVNNILSGGDAPEDIAKGILAVTAEASKQFPSSRIILFGLLPTGKLKDDVNRIKYDQIHAYLAKAKIKNAQYINPTEWFVNSDGSINTKLYSGDFIHLTPNGYELWSFKIAELITR